MLNIINYKLFLAFLAINFILFLIYFNIAKKIGFIDQSKKFNNPITVTASGIIIYFNFIIIIFVNIFLENNITNKISRDKFEGFLKVYAGASNKALAMLESKGLI